MRKTSDLNGRKLQFIISTLSSWLEEVENEVREAITILEDSDTGNMWWASRIRKRLVENSPPDPAAGVGDQAATLIEIAFWSGWLKGELETLQRCNLAVTSVRGKVSEQTSLPLHQDPSSAYKEGSVPHPADDGPRNSVMRLIELMDSVNYLPGAELVSIHLNSAVENSSSPEFKNIEQECYSALESLKADNRSSSLVRLSFDAGILAGLMLSEVKAAQNQIEGRGGDWKRRDV